MKQKKTKTNANAQPKKLQLRKERVRQLDRDSLGEVVGGADPGTSGCTGTTQFDVDQV